MFSISSNLKDTLTTIFGIVLAISGSIVSLSISGGVLIPVWLLTSSTIAATLSGTIIGLLTGKNPNGTTKSEAQVVTQNAQKTTLPTPVITVQPATTTVVIPTTGTAPEPPLHH
jgi:hypothetical protein